MSELTTELAKPAAAPASAASRLRAERPAPLPPSAPRAARLLLVDDKPELLSSLHELVTLHGYEADAALGGQQALELLAQGDYDVMLLDLIMPGISGHDILEFAAEQQLTTKIIVVSGDASFTGIKHALHCGAFDFVKKPYEAAELVATMETALRQCDLESRADDMEAQLKESEELHRFIVNSSPDLVYMLDRNGCFTFLNDRVMTLLGYDKDELIGRHYSELVDDDHLEVARNVFNERRTGERAAHNVEIRLKSKLNRQGARLLPHSVWMELTAMGVYTDPKERTRDNFSGTYGTARDITERKEAERVINFQAYHDLLTHLPNRVLLKDRLAMAITHARRNKRKLGVMFLDLDRFKIVNDTLGHTMGDRLLKAVAKRLQSCLRRGDTLARFGGDEFTLLLPEVRTQDDVVVIASKILNRLNAPFVIDGHELFVGASIGIALYPEAGETEEMLIQNADIAMYHIKGRGKNGYQFYTEEMNHQFSTRLSLERELHNALIEGQLRVHYQPQIDVATGAIVGVEALVRWEHPERGLVCPEHFLPVAQETGLIVPIDRRVQQVAFEEIAQLQRAGFKNLLLSVNLSTMQLEQEGFVDAFLQAIDKARLKPDSLKVEITENVLMQDVEVIVPKLKALRDKGIRVAIDDFGTGYSSLSYLQQFPINTLKIDRTFVHDIRAEQGDASIINAIVAMARGLNMTLIAEGVENKTQLNYLRQQGCQHVQGFYFSKPVTCDALKDLLKAQPFLLQAADH